MFRDAYINNLYSFLLQLYRLLSSYNKMEAFLYKSD